MIPLLLSTALAAPTMVNTGLVLTAPASGPFAGGINAPTVEYDRVNRRFVMYFESIQSTWPATCVNTYVIGRATSRDGVTWTLDASPVLTGDDADSTSNRHCGVNQPAVAFDGTTWHLMFSQARAASYSTAPSNESGGIAYATSTDGVNFTIVSDPAIEPSTNRATPVGLPTVAIDADTLYVVYDQYPDLHLATAPVDLSTGWSMEGMIVDNAAQSWSSTWLFGPSLQCHPVLGMTMFVGGDSSSGRSVGLASSPNAWDWTWDAETPIGSGDVPWSSLNHWDMLRSGDGASYAMWYSMTDSATGLKAVGHASTRPRRTRYVSRWCP